MTSVEFVEDIFKFFDKHWWKNVGHDVYKICFDAHSSSEGGSNASKSWSADIIDKSEKKFDTVMYFCHFVSLAFFKV